MTAWTEVAIAADIGATFRATGQNPSPSNPPPIRLSFGIEDLIDQPGKQFH
jgi:hypothetical protein